MQTGLRFVAAGLSRRVADWAMTLPLLRWSWTGQAETNAMSRLTEFRPADHETVLEMMAGRYLLAARLVDTGGISPFAVESEHDEWHHELMSFSWLRHFAETRDIGERRFARTLTLDWIGRYGRYSADCWAPGITAQRIMNWLRHLALLTEQASAEERKQILGTLGTQIEALNARAPFADDPAYRLLGAIALTGAAICLDSEGKHLTRRLARLETLLHEQIDTDGLHRSRNLHVQLDVMADLISVRQALGASAAGQSVRITDALEAMHRAFSSLTLGTGEPAYFNGGGPVPVDIMLAIMAQSTARRAGTALISGYGILNNGRTVLVADSGAVPDPDFARAGHASALAFELSFGNELVIGSCGPPPRGPEGRRTLLREAVAHSGPAISNRSSTHLRLAPLLGSHLAGSAMPPQLERDGDDVALKLMTSGFESLAGIEIERRLTLISEGNTLVGLDRMHGRPSADGNLVLRFHLGAGADAQRGEAEDIVRIRLASGARWTFLWEGAVGRIEESVRRTAFFGFQPTRQIVLKAPLTAKGEIAWILTLETA